MNVRRTATLLVLCSLSACASLGPDGGPDSGNVLRKATIELYRDENNKCFTHTTPYFKLEKGSGRKLVWVIEDQANCLSGDLVIEMKFKPGEPDLLPRCHKIGKRDQKKIYCDLNDSSTGRSSYSVWFNGQEEDPVLEIEQI